MRSLVWGTQATHPLSSQRPAPLPRPHVLKCNFTFVSHIGLAGADSRRSVRQQSIFGSNAGTPKIAPSKVQSNKWWHQCSDIFVEVRNTADFEREVLNSKKPVVVDWYAPWCSGCERSFPEVCKMLRLNDGIRKSFKFVKICVDDFPKSFARHQGVTALPRMSVYRPGYGRLIVLDIPHSKLGNLKSNLSTIFKNPTSIFKLDLNHNVVVDGPAPPPEQVHQHSGHHGGQHSSATRSIGSPASASSTNNTTAPGTSEAAAPAHSTEKLHLPPAMLNGTGNAKTGYVEGYTKLYGERYTQERQAFLASHGGDYGYGGRMDDLYQQEVGVRMGWVGPDHRPQHYLDYTGASLYLQSQLDAVFNELRTHIFGNPHSQNPSSALASDKVDEVRALVQKYFNADPEDWQVVFTPSATGALKLVGETFPWGHGSMFRYLRENHNSVLGVREYAMNKGGAFQALTEQEVELWVGSPGPPATGALSSPHTPRTNGTNGSDGDVTHSLFAFPAEENFAGVVYPLSRWCSEVKKRSTPKHKWSVMVDAAAYVPTHPLDLSTLDADFVCMSFYKMFGYPTGLGALLVRTEAVPLLRKLYWGGGSVALATATQNFHALKCQPSEMLEDGTVSFLSILALRHGLDAVNNLGGPSKIHSHVKSLTRWLHASMASLKHSNGAPMLRVFGKHGRPDSHEVQGGVLNFEVLSPAGTPLSYHTFETEAAAAGLHVRTGSHCNPGAAYAHLGVRDEEIAGLAGKKEGCDDDVETVDVMRSSASRAQEERAQGGVGESSGDEGSASDGDGMTMALQQVPLGSVRASLGWMSTFEDCFALVDFIAHNYKDRQV